MQKRILRAMLLVALLPLLGSGIISDYIIGRTLTRQVLNQLDSVAEVQKNRLDNLVDRNLERLQGVASRTQMRISLERHQREPNAVDRAKMIKIITDARESISDFIDITLVGTNGLVAASTLPGEEGADYRARGYYQAGRDAPQAGAFFLDRGGEPRVMLSGPLELSGTRIGTVVIRSRVDTIAALVRDYTGLGETGETLLVMPGKQPDQAVFLTPLRFDPDAAMQRRATTAPAIRSLSEGSEAFRDAVDYRGEQVLAATQNIPRTGWGLVVKMDRDEAFAGRMRLRLVISAILGASVVLVVLSSMTMARGITRPIGELTDTITRIQTGDLGRPCATDGPDEIGKLQRGMNAMMGYLQDYVHTANAVAEGNFTTDIRLHGEKDELGQALVDMRNSLQRTYEESSASREELQNTNEALAGQTAILERQKATLSENNRELDLARSELEIKAEQLARASRYKSEFLANMSHELRTPLNSLLILARMLSDNKPGNLTEKQVRYAHTIHRSGSDLLDLINDILDLSKVEAGRLEFHIAPSRIEDQLNELQHLFQLVADEKKLTFEVRKSDAVPEYIQTDAKRLQQIVKNLLSNAFKFTTRGGVILEVDRPGPDTAFRISNLDPAHTVAFRITDTGIGIPEEKQKLIFEAFQQADGSTSRSYGGTGLGLSITREFTQRLGGEVHVESGEGEGSSFTVYLPELAPGAVEDLAGSDAARPAAPQAVPPAPPAPAPDPNPPPAAATEVKPPLLLVVEDDPQFARILIELAEEQGLRHLLAGDGVFGLHLARTQKPDAIILDIQLPEMNGVEVKNRLNDDETTCNIPVLFISAMAPTEQVHRLGVEGYLTKPVGMEELNAAMQRIRRIAEGTLGRLLIVEDDPAQQEALLELVSDLQCESDVTATVEGAREFLENRRYDMLILDIGLYGRESGLELLEQMGQHPAAVLPPVIVYTARDLTRDETARLKPYTDTIMLKSKHSGEHLLDEVKRFLGNVTAGKTAAAPAAPKAPAPSGLEGRHVLLVDDDARNVYALRAALEEAGLRVSTAGSGSEALDFLRNRDGIDLVLMDIMMPDMDGYQATRAIREDRALQELPVIALTAKVMREDTEKCLAAGANDYLAKPVVTRRLLETISKWMPKKS